MKERARGREPAEMAQSAVAPALKTGLCGFESRSRHPGANRSRRSNTTALEDKMAVLVEIRAAEGGNDAKLLVEEQLKIYARLTTRRGL